MYMILMGIMMIVFGDMSNENIGSLIVLAGVLLKFVEKVYDNWQARRLAAAVATETAAKAAELKAALVVSDSKRTAHLNAQDERLANIAAQVSDVQGSVEVVKTQTNGVIEKIESAAYQKGVTDGKCQDVNEQTSVPGTTKPVSSSDSAIGKGAPK